MYIARDKDDSLWLFSSKPNKYQSHWDLNVVGDIVKLEPALYPSVKWDDKEPTEVEIVIKKNVEERIRDLFKITNSKIIVAKTIQGEYDISLSDSFDIAKRIMDEILNENK